MNEEIVRSLIITGVTLFIILGVLLLCVYKKKKLAFISSYSIVTVLFIVFLVFVFETLKRSDWFFPEITRELIIAVCIIGIALFIMLFFGIYFSYRNKKWAIIFSLVLTASLILIYAFIGNSIVVAVWYLAG